MASPFILGLFISFIGVAVILFLPYQEMQHWVHNLILEHKAVKTIHLFTPISGFYLYYPYQYERLKLFSYLLGITESY